MAKNRFVGVDLGRAIAAFAVVVIHAGGEVQYPDALSSLAADSLLLGTMQACRFAVPFFLATSFYFVVGKLLKAPKQFDITAFLKSRVTRLLVPYVLWSLIYLAVRLLKAVRTPEGIAPLFQDPVFLIFFGGAAIHLYFLPLLLTGSLLIPALKGIIPALKKRWVCILLLLVSLALYEATIVTGNNFELGVNCLEKPQQCAIAFQPLLQSVGLQNNPWMRFLSTELHWIIRCTMFISASVLLHHPAIQQWLARMQQGWVWAALFFVATLGGLLEYFKVCYFPLSLYELGVGYGPLLWGLVLSKTRSLHPLWSHLGNLSFGIYLAHYLVLVFYSTLLPKLPPIILTWPPTILAILLATLTFVTSGAIAVGLAQQPLFRRWLLSS